MIKKPVLTNHIKGEGTKEAPCAVCDKQLWMTGDTLTG